jgi:hypothetical protein
VSDELMVRLDSWDGPWSPDDPDANFKSDVALYTKLDPLETVTSLSERTGIPVGALVRYVLAKWASAGSETLMSAGPSVVERLWAVCEAAELAATSKARLEAYGVIREMVSWLRAPLDEGS